MSLKRSMLLTITAALFFSGASFADEPGTVAVETAGEKDPEVIIHKIVPRDTLWDITGHYLKNPFKWPNIWKLNPYIKNPHLIYPGNTVKLTPNGIEVLSSEDAKAEGLAKVGLEPQEGEVLVLEPDQEKDQAQETTQAAAAPVAEPVAPKGPSYRDYAMARSGFISDKEFQASGAVVGPKEDKLLITSEDEVFLSFKDKSAVKEGGRYTVYKAGKKIVHPETGRSLGYETEILGSLVVTRINGFVEALVDTAYMEIPAGAKVKPYSEPVREVEIIKADSEISGVIVMALEGRENIAAGDIAYVDKGSKDGLKKGNIMRIFRMLPEMDDPMGGKDVIPPPVELGTLVVLEAGEKTSTAIVVKGLKAINWGDKVSTAEAY